MKSSLKQHFIKIGPRRFVIGTVLLLVVMDLINSYYLKIYWLKKDLSLQMVHQSIRRSEMEIEDFSRATVAEWAELFNNTFYFFLIIILMNNLFFYLFYLRQRLWAQAYVLFYTITAALFSLTFLWDNAGLGTHWLVYNIGSALLYLYLFAGVKLLKTETTLAPEKKGQ
jgi:hypothetical protein